MFSGKNVLPTKVDGAPASRTCVVTRTYSTFGDRAFGAAGPGLWNSLPSHLKDANISYSEFRRSLKTFLFGQWGHGAVWTVLTAPTRNIVTYLLTYLCSFSVMVAMGESSGVWCSQLFLVLMKPWAFFARCIANNRQNRVFLFGKILFF